MTIISVLLIIAVQKEDVYMIQYPADQILVLEIHATQLLDVLIPQLFAMIITHVPMMDAIQILDAPSILLIVTMVMLVLKKNVIQFLAVYTQKPIVTIMISVL
jgi:hypothetical protein